MKRTRAQQPKLQEAQDGAGNPNPKPQRRAKQQRQPKAAAAATKKAAAAAARESSSAAGAAVASAASSSPGTDMAPTVPDVCGGGGHEAGAATVEWDLDGGLSNGSSWWTFGVEEEKLLGWFPFVEEDFRCLGGRGDAEMAFDDDIWRIHQIYEIPNYAAK
ncbi:hypothetical protein E2562_023577 [Oryza meyeriana var. granulata]|uniref:Uncharacterized protein n=1 Tax=Oryza meyeriana var. granulata TaxID=110450 RepID=A0A6G1E0X1_9ORYZ|nr:hypothetical protein E2562_023577 [Oryza meyeriana var. granulata]